MRREMREIEEIWRELASHALAILVTARDYAKGSRELLRRNINQEVASNIGSENRTLEQDVVGHESFVPNWARFFRDSAIAGFTSHSE